MRDFREYSPEDIILANLRETSNRRDMLTEQELAHLRELATEILASGDLQEILSSLSERRIPDTEPYTDALEQNKEALSSLHRFQRAQRSILLCSILCPLLTAEKGLSTEAFFPDALLHEPSEHVRVTYPKSSYTDSAYLALSPFLGEARAVYSHSFPFACEEVYNGLCDYCILPLENSTEGMLAVFLRLILRYELKIAATCEVENHSEGKTTRFALLHKGMRLTSSPTPSELQFAMALPDASVAELTDLPGAASFFGLSLCAACFLPKESRDGRTAYLAFSLPPSEIDAFLLYLSMEIPQYIPVGLYPNIHIQKKGRS